MSLLELIQHERRIFLSCKLESKAYWRQMRLVAEFTKQWRESNSLRAVK